MEFEKDLFEKAEEFLYNYSQEGASRSYQDFVVCCNQGDIKEIREQLIDINSWVDFIAAGNDNLYESYTYHVFPEAKVYVFDNGIVVVQGKELDYE